MSERRTYGRVPVARGALINCGKRRGIFAGMVRDISEAGFKIELGRLRVPAHFTVSFDQFDSTQSCRVIWRDHQYLGAAFDRT